MENAARALYISAGVLIAVMILSLAGVLYSSMQGYVQESNNEIKQNNISGFNTKYLNYVNYTGGTQQFELTIQDVVTVASSAYENNSKYEVDTSQWSAGPDALYVQVNLGTSRIDQTINDKNAENNMINLLEKNKEKKYKCESSDVLISQSSGQVYSISFSAIN